MPLWQCHGLREPVARFAREMFPESLRLRRPPPRMISARLRSVAPAATRDLRRVMHINIYGNAAAAAAHGRPRLRLWLPLHETINERGARIARRL